MIGLRIHRPQHLGLAAAGVDLGHRSPAIRYVQVAVCRERRAFKAAMRPDAAALDTAKLQRPGDMQILDVVLVDLLQRREPLCGVILVVSEPIPRIGIGLEQPVRRHLVGSKPDRRAA